MSDLSPNITFSEEPPAIVSIGGVPTAVAGVVGVTERGPIGVPTLCNSWDDYERHFGGLLAAPHYLPLAIKTFFENGGTALYVVRTVHYVDVSDPATATAVRNSGTLNAGAGAAAAVQVGGAGPFNLADGDQLVLAVDGGGDNFVTFNGSAASLRTALMGPFDLEDGWTLLFTVDGGEQQTVTFDALDVGNIDAVTGAEVVEQINKQATGCRAFLDFTSEVVIESDTKGTASSVVIDGGTAAATLNFAAHLVAGGNVADIDAVTADEVKAAIDLLALGSITVTTPGAGVTLTTVPTGLASSIEIRLGTAAALGFTEGVETGSDDAAAPALVVDDLYPGAPTGLTAQVAAATNGEAGEFDLLVLREGAVVESFANVSMTPAHDRYVETVVAGASRFIRATDQGLLGNPRPTDGTAALVGGDDGLTDLADVDFIGASADAGRTGLRALDTVLDLSLLLCAGRATAGYAAALNAYAETTRNGRVFVVHDTPGGLTVEGARTYVKTTASLKGSSEYGGVWWPWVTIPNPSRTIFGSAASIAVPNSGAIAGMMSRNDGAPGGVYRSPAGTSRGRLLLVVGVENEDANLKPKRDLLYPDRINVIHTAEGSPMSDGGRTLLASGSFPNVSERRGVIFIKGSIDAGLTFVKHENHDASLRARVTRTVRAFLLGEMGRGAFRSRKAAEAFFVTCDTSNNPPTEVAAGRLNVKIGLATQKPAEFVSITITQDTRDQAAQLAG